jgi:hypothetical protein
MSNRVFQLQPYSRGTREFNYVVIVPEYVSGDAAQLVQAAWSYAVRYTAKGLDLPDHETALQLLSERHPSWTIIQSRCHSIAIDLSKADQDVPETT